MFYESLTIKIFFSSVFMVKEIYFYFIFFHIFVMLKKAEFTNFWRRKKVKMYHDEAKFLILYLLLNFRKNTCRKSADLFQRFQKTENKRSELHKVLKIIIKISCYFSSFWIIATSDNDLAKFISKIIKHTWHIIMYDAWLVLPVIPRK